MVFMIFVHEYPQFQIGTMQHSSDNNELVSLISELVWTTNAAVYSHALLSPVHV